MPYYFFTKEDKLKQQIAMIIDMGRTMGKSEEEIKDMIEKAKKHGSL